MFPLRRWDWVLHIAAILFCSYFLVKGAMTHVANILESVEPPLPSRDSSPERPFRDETPPEDTAGGLDRYDVIVQRNVFNSKADPKSGSGPTDVDPEGFSGPAVATSLDVKVRSTFVVGDGTDRRSSTVVQNDKKKWLAYFVQDEESFAPGVKLVKVARDRIEFLHRGRLEYAELSEFKDSVFRSPDEVFGSLDRSKRGPDASRGGTSSSGDAIVVAQSDVERALGNLSGLQREVRLTPYFMGGRIEGFKILSVRPGGLISKLGVKRNDVLQKVNGQELDIQRGMELFGSLRDAKNFSVEVLRGGETLTLEYEIR